MQHYEVQMRYKYEKKLESHGEGGREGALEARGLSAQSLPARVDPLTADARPERRVGGLTGAGPGRRHEKGTAR